jgi:hypothetical protein
VTYTAEWVAGARDNTATANGTYGSTQVTDSDPANYFGSNPRINIVKVTDNGTVAADGILAAEGSAISWYVGAGSTDVWPCTSMICALEVRH